jgi:hypothetical protein
MERPIAAPFKLISMSFPTCVRFEAGPDLSLFRFNTGFAGSAVFQLRFSASHPDIYDATVEYLHCFPGALYIPLTDEQVEELLLVMVQMIELYTQKYPERRIRLKGGGHLQSMLFKVMLLVHQDAMRPWFTIDEERRKLSLPFFRGRDSPTFFLKRKPDTRQPAPIQTILHTRSRLFGNPVHVQVCEN